MTLVHRCFIRGGRENVHWTTKSYVGGEERRKQARLCRRSSRIVTASSRKMARKVRQHPISRRGMKHLVTPSGPQLVHLRTREKRQYNDATYAKGVDCRR